MLEGKCPKCSNYCVGWALRFPRNQVCAKCGTALEITEDGGQVVQGFSPFSAPKYTLNLPDDIPSHQDKD